MTPADDSAPPSDAAPVVRAATILNRRGLHARAAAKLPLATTFDARSGSPATAWRWAAIPSWG